jgi:hypothetical protein
MNRAKINPKIKGRKAADERFDAGIMQDCRMGDVQCAEREAGCIRDWQLKIPGA